MVDLVQPPWLVYIGGRIVLNVLEGRVVLEVGDVLKASGARVVHADHPVALREPPLGEVAPAKPRPPVTSTRFFAIG